MRIYKTLLFDADNTLLDFDKSEETALKKTFAAHGIDFTTAIENCYMEINHRLWKAYEEGELTREEVIYTRFGRLFAKFGIQEDGVAFEKIYQQELGRGHALMPQALEVVSLLKQTYDLYIVTNGVTATQYSRLKDSGLDQHIRKVFVSEEVGYRKPMKEYFDYCFQQIPDIDLNRTLIIGDSLSSDIQGGINAGIDTCWMNPKHQKNDKGLKITYEIDHLTQLYELLA